MCHTSRLIVVIQLIGVVFPRVVAPPRHFNRCELPDTHTHCLTCRNGNHKELEEHVRRGRRLALGHCGADRFNFLYPDVIHAEATLGRKTSVNSMRQQIPDGQVTLVVQSIHPMALFWGSESTKP